MPLPALLLCSALAVQAPAQDLEITVIPEVIHAEELGGAIVPIERVFFHVIFHNRASEPIELQWVRFDLAGSDGSVVSGQFSGAALEQLFDDSIARRRIEPTPTGTLVLGPDQRKALSDIFVRLPAGLMGRALVVESEFRLGQELRSRMTSAPVRAAEGLTARLPFDGIWHVLAEHGSMDAHKRFVAEAFAYDFARIGETGRTYEADGRENADYFAYGQPVLAAAAGEVVYVRDDVAENVPGQTMPAVPGGNAVVIRHAEGQYSYYAHMRPGRMDVGVGDRVAAGDRLGEVGNSGDSTEPHLHFHAMDGPDPSRSQGIPVLFESWMSGAQSGIPVLRRGGVISRGDFVLHPR